MAARKFLDSDEAAAMLSVTPDKLNDLRLRGKINAYRDGANWKYKPEEVERYMSDLADEAGEGGGEAGDNLDSILLSEVELGEPTGHTSSTVIGKSKGPDSEGSDLKLTSEGSDLKLGGSDVRLASDSAIGKAGSGLSAKFDDLDPLDLDLGSSMDSGLKLDAKKPVGKSSMDEDLTLDDQDLALGGDETISLQPASSGKLTGGSAINLAAEDDDDLVLGGSGLGSDVTLDAGSSGISLVDPGDSGLSLEEAPLSLAGSSKKIKSLDVPGDDEMILLEEEGDSEAATQLKADDDFLLTPLDDAGVDESDSGSQVIALDSDVDFDESAATMLGGKMGAVGMLEEDLGGDMGAADFGSAAGPSADLSAAAAAGGAMLAAPQAVEAPYSFFNVAFLSIGVVLLLVTGMMTYDLLRNMWSWDGPYAVNSSIMDGVLEMFDKK